MASSVIECHLHDPSSHVYYCCTPLHYTIISSYFCKLEVPLGVLSMLFREFYELLLYIHAVVSQGIVCLSFLFLSTLIAPAIGISLLLQHNAVYRSRLATHPSLALQTAVNISGKSKLVGPGWRLLTSS